MSARLISDNQLPVLARRIICSYFLSYATVCVSGNSAIGYAIFASGVRFYALGRHSRVQMLQYDSMHLAIICNHLSSLESYIPTNWQGSTSRYACYALSCHIGVVTCYRASIQPGFSTLPVACPLVTECLNHVTPWGHLRFSVQMTCTSLIIISM